MRILVTGATGYLGSELVVELSQFGHEVTAVVRTPIRSLAATGCEVVVIGSNEPKAALKQVLNTVQPEVVVHAAANTDFGQSRQVAESANIDLTSALLAAMQPHRAMRLCYLSTLYVAGTQTGNIEERPSRATAFSNNYEWSKNQAERLVLASGQPSVLVRLPTIIADDETGRVSAFNVFHQLLYLMKSAMLPMVPAERSTPVYLGLRDLIVREIALLITNEAIFSNRIIQVADDHPPTAGDVIDWAHRAMCTHINGWRVKGVLPPLFVGQDCFELMMEASSGLLPEGRTRTIETLRPFSRQLSLPKYFINDNYRTSCPQRGAPDWELWISLVVKSMFGSIAVCGVL